MGMKDRHGHEFADLVAIQQTHLDHWGTKLRREVYGHVSSYVLETNQEATSPEQAHRVFRGQDLVQIILDYPELSAAYPPRKTTSDLI